MVLLGAWRLGTRKGKMSGWEGGETYIDCFFVDVFAFVHFNNNFFSLQQRNPFKSGHWEREDAWVGERRDMNK